jgi:hypothetical protein
MASVTAEFLAAELEVADRLRAGRDAMLEPQDLPGRYGRVIQAIDRLLQVIECPAVVAGGWAVWRHGYLGRVTQDVDVVIPADRLDEVLRVAAVSGFEVLPSRAGLWPKLHHKESDVNVVILPEGATPGTPSKPAPTTIPHPKRLGASGTKPKYIDLAGLIELKLAAGRVRDESDVAELIRANPDQIDAIRQHLHRIHDRYTARFEELVSRAREETDH